MSDFKSIITGCCSQIGWDVHEADGSHATMRFSMASGRIQNLYIIKCDSSAEFSVPSSAVFSINDEEIPHELSSIFLMMNSQRKFGAWCMEKIGESLVYSLMHNCELRMLNKEYFQLIVSLLVSDCEEFDCALAQLGSAAQQSGSASISQCRTSVPTGSYTAHTGSFDWGRVLQTGAETLVRVFVQDAVNSMFDNR